ncbi:MAG: hypothetical protein IT434_02765, partial [Phycisphaerales bacterium]|nr:hypothetical protein [Phycisphaerales bacterium]
MFEPDDFGLGPSATLAHVADPAPSRFHVPVWNAWTKGIVASTPRLTAWTSPEIDPADGTATHQFESSRHVRIGCRLFEPHGVAKAGIVALHGYDEPPALVREEERWAPLVARGAAVLAIRVRGYPGSMLDTGDWTSGSWLCRGLDVPHSGSTGDGSDSTATDLQAWSLVLGVADVVNALRALAAHLGHGVPLYLSGESFGAGLGAIATGLLAAHPEIGVEVSRLRLGLPTLGDWRWRLCPTRRSRAGGAQRQITEMLTLHASRSEELIERLRVGDAAIHAQRIRCKVLCKLALRDEV